MDINRLHYFSVLCRAGSITKASELLNISQPALSKAIKTLEYELGQKLIAPAGRGIVITDYGHKLVAHCEPLLDQLARIPRLNEQQQQEQSLSIATFEVFSTYFLTSVIQKHFSTQKMTILERVPGEIEEDIQSRRADIGITYLPIPHPELDTLEVTSIEMGVYGPKSFSKSSFQYWPFIVPVTPVRGTPSKARGLDGFPDDKISRKIRHRTTLLETALQWASVGMGVGYFPTFIVELFNASRANRDKLIRLREPKGLKGKRFKVYLVKRKSDLENSDFKKIAMELRKLH
jgi:DNA-binding transcriptional LysR family regulator